MKTTNRLAGVAWLTKPVRKYAEEFLVGYKDGEPVHLLRDFAGTCEVWMGSVLLGELTTEEYERLAAAMR